MLGGMPVDASRSYHWCLPTRVVVLLEKLVFLHKFGVFLFQREVIFFLLC